MALIPSEELVTFRALGRVERTFKLCVDLHFLERHLLFAKVAELGQLETLKHIVLLSL